MTLQKCGILAPKIQMHHELGAVADQVQLTITMLQHSESVCTEVSLWLITAMPNLPRW